MSLFASPHIAGLTVLAIDPGTSLGYALKLADGVCRHGVHRWPAEPKGLKWRALMGMLSARLRDADGRIDHVYIEYSTWARQPLAMLDHGGFVALVEYWCEMSGIPAPVKVNPATIKKHICGRSRGVGKQPVLDAVNAMGFKVDSHDEADAIALLDYAIGHLGWQRRVA